MATSHESDSPLLDSDSKSPPSSSSDDSSPSEPPDPSSSPPPDSPSGSSPPPPSASPTSGKDQTPPPSPCLTPPPLPSRKSPPPPPRSSDGSPSSNAALITGIAVGAGLLLFVLVAFVVSCCNKKKRRNHDPMHHYNDASTKGGENHSNGQAKNTGWGMPPRTPPTNNEACSSGPQGPALPPPRPSLALGLTKSSFTYDELASATSGFSDANLLGQGGFGFVHKGVLPNGREIAVKSLKSGSGQGEREFQAEVEIISRVHHRHLVSLVGYSIAGGQRMLVYEFVPNNSLEFHLHGKGQPTMDFSTRLKIALGSAKGLAYLHEDCHPRIIHRDIKSANILLDHSFDAKVADFGLAKLSQDNFTHVSTRVMGTFGYLAPEYAASGKLTEKSDVFSYGVMLLELITGRHPVDPTGEDDGLVDWARPLLNRALDEGNFEGLADPRLENNFNIQEMMRMVACAAASIRHSAKKRPKMSQIVHVLEGDVSFDNLTEANKPGSSSIPSSNGSEHELSSYNNDMQKFRKRGMNSQEYASGEQGNGNASNSGVELPGILTNESRTNSPALAAGHNFL